MLQIFNSRLELQREWPDFLQRRQAYCPRRDAARSIIAGIGSFLKVVYLADAEVYHKLHESVIVCCHVVKAMGII